MSKKPFFVRSLASVEPHEFEGMRIRPLILKEDTRKMVAYHITIPPKTRVPHSYHKKATEIIHVLAGEGIAHLNKRNVRIRVKDSIFVRPWTWHSFSTGKRSMTLLAVLSPRVDSKTDLYHR